MARRVTDHEHALGLSLRQEADKQFNKMLFFATTLLFVHLLGISPSEIDAAGLKFKIADPAIIYGAISLVFLHYLFRSLSFTQRGESFLRLAANKATIRSAIETSRQTRKKKGIRKIKKGARLDIAIYNGFMAPYYIVVTLIIVVAIAGAAVDVYFLGDFILDHAQTRPS